MRETETLRGAPHDAASLRAWQQEQRLTSEALARRLGVSVYAVNHWRAGLRRIVPLVARALRDVGRSRELREPWAAFLREGGHEAFEAWRIDRGLTQIEVARRLPITHRTVREWSYGRRPFTIVAVRALKDLDREIRQQQPRPKR